MGFKWKWKSPLFVIYLAMVMLRVDGQDEASTESSAEYLQKVMFELQELNVPSTTTTKSVSYTPKVTSERPVFHTENKVEASRKEYIDKYPAADPGEYSFPPPKRQPTLTDTIAHYFKLPAPQASMNLPSGDPLAFTRAELAAMYKTALEKGTPVSFAGLKEALSSVRQPHVTDTHLEIPQQQSPYQYYFYPLRTFMGELQNDYGYKTIPALPPPPPSYIGPEVAETAPDSQKQVASPLFMAISSFIAMAVLFMMGVLFLPKFLDFGEFQSRQFQDDSQLHLTKIIAEAIDDCSEKSSHSSVEAKHRLHRSSRISCQLKRSQRYKRRWRSFLS